MLFAKMFRAIAVALMVLSACSTFAQDRLKTMPGGARYERVTRGMTNLFVSGALSVTWTNDGKAFEYSRDGKRWRYDIAAGAATELGARTNSSLSRTNRRSGDSPRPERGRQYTSMRSPDGKFTALFRDQNVWLRADKETNRTQITTEGSVERRIKLGSATWVYGEELYQSTAMWWSSNSQKMAFYRFDESPVPNFYLQMDQTKLISTAD